MFPVGWNTTGESELNSASLFLVSLTFQLSLIRPTGTLCRDRQRREAQIPQPWAKALMENAKWRGLWLLTQTLAVLATLACAETSRDSRRPAAKRECGNTPQGGRAKGTLVVCS